MPVFQDAVEARCWAGIARDAHIRLCNHGCGLLARLAEACSRRGRYADMRACGGLATPAPDCRALQLVQRGSKAQVEIKPWQFPCSSYAS